MSFSLYFQHEEDIAALKYQQLPAIEKYAQRQLLLIKNDRLLSEIISSKYAGQFSDYHQVLNENLQNISGLSRNNRRLLEQLAQRLQMQTENIMRLSESDRRNIQLKDNVIIQLTIVADSLSDLITRQTNQQKDLYRQLTQDNLTDRVTATRAKALSNLVNNINRNRELYQALIDTLVMFNQLDLQYDLINFDYIQQKIHQEINHWLAEGANMADNNIEENGLFEQVSVLNALLFSEQNTFAKWRGQLRRVNDFQAELINQKTELLPLLDKKLVIRPLQSSAVEQQIIHWLAKANISLQAKDTLWFILVFFVLLVIVFISVLVSIQRKIKSFGVQSAAVIEELVTQGEIASVVPGLEITTIINSINQLARPEHSEADFKAQQQHYQIHAKAMSRHSGFVFWQMPVASIQKQQLQRLLGGDSHNQHWRHCFNRSDVHAILSLARKAKKQSSVEKISLITHQQKAVALTVEYIDGVWYGSLSSAEEYRALNDENIQLQQQLKQQSQADKLAVITHSESTIALASAAMQQRQLLSLAAGDEEVAYQHIRQLFCWGEQQKISAQLRRDDFILSLSTVNFANEMHTALLNISLEQAPNNNFIYLNLANNLTAFVTLESELFQAMITTTCQRMLAAQRNVELSIDVQVIDVNSAQQIVRISFKLSNPVSSKKLSQTINRLVIDDENSTVCDSTSHHFLRDLQLVFNVSNKEAQQLDKAGKFSFDLPLTIAEDSDKSSKENPVKLAKCCILVIATNKASRQRICQHFSNSKVTVETMQDLSLFQRQISIKHLTKNRLDVVVLSPEVYFSDYDLISQHLASLPAKLQPKILVIQPFYSAGLSRKGLFSANNFPWFTSALVENLAVLKNKTHKTNILVEPEVFLPYKFLPTQVEVLLAVEMVSKYQSLIQVLQWLGLKVTVVSQQERLESLWQSARYTVVITEFLPFKAKLKTAINCLRGVFSLNEDNTKQDFFSQLELPKAWHNGRLASALDIEQLTQQLLPWLKVDKSICENKVEPVSKSQCGKASEHETAKVSSVSDDADFAAGMEIIDIEQSLDFTLNLAQTNDSAVEAFDLVNYASNQGSAELAAFMLDEYMTDIIASTRALDDALQQQDYHLAIQLLKSLIATVSVISAAPFLAACRQLSQLLSEQDANGAFSIAQKEQLQQQLNHLKLCLEQLTDFAESI